MAIQRLFGQLTCIQPVCRVFTGSLRGFQTITRKLTWKISALPPNRPIHNFTYLTRNRQRYNWDFEKGNADGAYKLVYENRMARMIFWTQILINSITVPGIGLCAYIIFKYRNDQPELLTKTVVTSIFSVLLFLLAFKCGQHCLIRIYHNEKTGSFVGFYRNWLMQKQRLNFTAAEVKPKKSFTSNLVNGGSILIQGKSFFVSGNDFVAPAYFNRFMGYELDRELETIEDFIAPWQFSLKFNRKKSTKQ